MMLRQCVLNVCLEITIKAKEEKEEGTEPQGCANASAIWV
jgi:hypothetical protein